MYTEELKLPKDIECKFLRLTFPSLNSLSLPLSGVYNNLDNTFESSEFPLKNKFKHFDLPSPECVNMENLFSISTSFGKIYTKEQLIGLIILSNISDHEITIKEIKLTLKIDSKEKAENNNKEKEKELIPEGKFPKNGILIGPKKSYSVKIQVQFNYYSKYIIEIYVVSKSNAYDQKYYAKKQTTLVKESGKDYRIVRGHVEFIFNRVLSVEVNYPFVVTELFHNEQINKCFIEIRISNNTLYPLTLVNLFLTPKDKKDIKIPLVYSLEEINHNKYCITDKNESNNDKNKIKCNCSKYLTIQSDEQVIVLFYIDKPDLFYNEKYFKLSIHWLNLFDLITKNFEKEFENSLNTFNNYFKLTVKEKPTGDIIENQNLKIELKFETKNPEIKYSISLSKDKIESNEDKSDDREINIIDIIPKKLELSQKIPSNSFKIICRSDIIGNVYLPKLKITLYEGSKMAPVEFSYNALLTFNCIPKKY